MFHQKQNFFKTLIFIVLQAPPSCSSIFSLCIPLNLTRDEYFVIIVKSALNF